MIITTEYTPPKVWTWDKENGGKFASINRPVAGATHQKDLPVGRHPLQLYSLATPNGVKVTVMLEELLAIGCEGAEYDAWLIRIEDGDQFGSGFVGANPNSKIPALVDHSGDMPVRVFESGAILQYLAEKFEAFLPATGAARAECLSWLFWQMGSAPFLGGGTMETHAWQRFHVRYYSMVLLFIAFEMEMMFMYPWAVVFVEEGAKALMEMGMFLAILSVGIVYAWREGVFRWQ